MRDGLTLKLTSSHWRSTPDEEIWYWNSIQDEYPIPADALARGDYSAIPGNWAAILVDDSHITLVMDRMRSVSILYAFDGGRWIVTDSPEALRPELSTWKADQQQAEIFPHVGFSVGRATLIDGVRTVQAASTTTLSIASRNAHTSFYGAFRFSSNRCDDEVQFAEIFSAFLDQTVGDLIARAAGRQLAVPLSGGIDSRLLLLWLRRLDAPNVVAFTYGIPGSAEVAVSQKIAHQLDTPWFVVSIAPGDIRKAWFNEEADAFLSQTWGGTSLPHVQDWFALRTMKRESLLQSNAIILPGHTVVGNMHDVELLQHTPTRSEIMRAILTHNSLQVHPVAALRNSRVFYKAVVDAFAQARYDGSPASLQAAIEWFNLRERQAKYINNSMRGYEFFGWDWALPMCSEAAFEVWSLGGQELTATRDWYQRFMDEHFAAATDVQASYYASVSETSLPAPAKRVLLALMRRLRLDRVLSRLRSVRSMMHHPMGFDGFIADSHRLRVRMRMLRGETSLGFWAQSFLNNAWGSPYCDIVPPQSPDGDSASR